MPSVTFSLTERMIIDPVLHMRAALLNDPQSPPGIGNKIWHFVEAEIIARITAVFISIFAAIDAFVHLFTGLYKGGYLLVGKCCNIPHASWNTSEVYDHFRGAAFFTGIALIGSIVGPIWPGVFKYFRQAPSNPSDEGNNTDPVNEKLPGTLLELVEAVQNGQEQAPFDRLRHFWQNSNLSNRRLFVEAFNQNHETFQAVRQTLADIVYRPIKPLAERTIQWLNEKEVSSQAQGPWERTNEFSKGFFFHATSPEALQTILTTKRVEVRHEKAFRGAFVSTQPELGFGRCVLVFKHTIERLSSLTHGFTIDQETYWAGFSRDIPVTANTLAYIILDSQNVNERQTLEHQCHQWTGRNVHVILMDDIRSKLRKIKDLDMGIPEEWPEEGEQNGQKILRAIQLIAIPLTQVPVAVAVSENQQEEYTYVPQQPVAGKQMRYEQRMVAIG